MTSWKTTTAPASEPISTADAKTYLAVSTSSHDTMIDNLISAARNWYEADTGTAVITQTITQIWDCTPCNWTFELSVGPVTDTPVVYYKDTDGTYQVWDAANYTVDTISDPSRIVKTPTAAWPVVGNFPAAWKVVYSAGYSSAATVPEDVVQSILLMVGFYYENREDIPIGESNNPRIRSAAALAFRRKRLVY